MAEGGPRLPMDNDDNVVNTFPIEGPSRLHTERLASNRSRETERKISFPERGFRQPAGRMAVAPDPFGEHEEDQAAHEERIEVPEELVQARNPHPVARPAGLDTVGDVIRFNRNLIVVDNSFLFKRP